MIKKWLTYANYGLVGLIALLLLAALYHFLFTPSEFPLPDVAAKKVNIPKSGFERTKEEYQAIGSPALTLSFSPLSVQLPDLRRHLNYYGKNTRPDSDESTPLLFFSFSNNKTTSHVAPGEKLYVMYDKKLSPPQYVFVEDGTEAPLWIEATPQGNQAVVKVSMRGENGQIIKEPASYAEFNAPEKEFVRFGGTVWELGKLRVDGTLLSRQRAKWQGMDKFIEDHGGEEFADWIGKQRIDFGEGEDAYSVYVGQGDCLVWKDDRWFPLKAVEDSNDYPLMCVKKVDERIMNLELWDIGGKGKMVLNMVKGTESWTPQNLEQGFKFVGARTRSQFIFEINQERMTLSPQDWLLQTDLGWIKLQTPEEIDEYVERKKTGPLFVFDAIEKKDDRQVIVGTLYNASRTDKLEIELPLQQAVGGLPAKGNRDERKKSKDLIEQRGINGDIGPASITPGSRGVELRMPQTRPNPNLQGPPPVARQSYIEEDDDDDDYDDDD